MGLGPLTYDHRYYGRWHDVLSTALRGATVYSSRRQHILRYAQRSYIEEARLVLINRSDVAVYIAARLPLARATESRRKDGPARSRCERGLRRLEAVAAA